MTSITSNNSNTLNTSVKKDKEETSKRPSLEDFLKAHRVTQQERERGNTKITHTALPNPGVRSGGSYHIPVDKMEAFYQVYYNDVFNNSQIYHLTEAHHQEVSPILIDLDFRQKSEDNPDVKKIYTDEDIKTYLRVFHKVLSQYIDEDVLNEHEIAYVMEKKKAVKGKGNLIKDGIHIVYPTLCPPYKIQFLARHDMVENKEIQELFKKMNVSNDIRNIIDLSVIRANNWFMYGSTKPEFEPYTITHIYSMGTGECESLQMKNPNKCSYKLFKNLSISFKKELTPIKIGIDDSIRKKYEGIPDSDKDNTEKNGVNSKKLSKAAVVSKNSAVNKNKIDDKEFEFAERLTKECLSVKRATDYESWIRVCWCLSNIDSRLEDAFIEFSKKCPGKFDEIDCRNRWNNASARIMERRLGVGTLHKWAKEDNQAKYREITRDSLGKLLYVSTNQTHTDVARYIYEKYKHEFKCSSITNDLWYHYKDNKWNLNEKGNELKKKISSEVAQDYYDYAIVCSNKANEYKEDCTEKESWTGRFKKSNELVSKLKTQSYKSSVVNECKEFFYDSKFEEELDSNDNLLHFLNGIYDLDKNEFRDGYPEDNITLSTGINYIEHLDPDDYEKMSCVEELVNKILPIEDIKNYVLTLFSSFLHGSNKEQKFHIWTGVGSNGKSMLIDFYKKTVGGYYGSMPITVLTQGRAGSEQASPVLAATRGKRFISLDEAESEDSIKVGFMKLLTGGDEITARGLNRPPITFKPKFKLVLTCNELPKIPSNDDGTWRRIRVVEFISKFCDNPNPNKQYEFLIDRSLTDKLEELREVFMYMLIKYYQHTYKPKGVHEPFQVVQQTKQVRDDNNVYAQFMEETICEDAKSSFGLDEIFTRFRTFLQNNSFDKTKYTRRGLEEYLNKTIGKCNMKKKWKGYRLSSNEEFGDEGEIIE
jgi:P4 family phage/plasmid primase-like protien